MVLAALGFLQFYSALFFSKYFEYTYTPLFGLLVIYLTQLIGIWSVLWQPRISRFRRILYPLSLLALFSLSLSSDQSSPGHLILMVCLIILFLQSEIIWMMKSMTIPPQIRYALELAGGLLGVIVWTHFASELGFFGYVLVFFIIINWIIWMQFKKPRWLIFSLFFSALLLYFLQEPRPVLKKQDRDKLVASGEVLEKVWDPSGHVELIDSNIFRSEKILSFEGGLLRSHIYEFDGDFKNLGAQYLRSLSPGLRSIDVALPHFVKRNRESTVALISCVGGQEALAARAFGAKKIYAIDINRSGLELANRYTIYKTGRLFTGEFQQVNEDGRRFVEKSQETFDVIQIYSSASASFSSAFGSYFVPSLLISKEAIQSYLEHLKSDGILQITQFKLNKLWRVIDAALGQDAFFSSPQLLVFRDAGPQETQINVVIKKDGWKPQEIDELLKWLEADQRKKWKILVNPMQSAELNRQNLLRENEDFLDKRPVTDNWPFWRISSPYFNQLPFQRLLLVGLVVAIVCAASMMYFRRKESFLIQKSSWNMGITFGVAQCLLVFEMQKIFGLPHLGLGYAIVSLLAIAILATLIPERTIPIRILIFVIGFYCFFHHHSYSLVWVHLLTLGVLVFAQSQFFAKLLPTAMNDLNTFFYFNGLGYMAGVLAFNLVFSLFGYWQTQILLGVLYFFVFIQRDRNGSFLSSSPTSRHS